MKPRVYFPGLNGIRFLAALAVMICHMEMTKHWFHEPNIYTVSFVGGVLGDIGVILFFVLSGFLITYLLLQEQQDLGTIKIKQFYIRRILRIWPLYYMVILLGLFVLPFLPETKGRSLEEIDAVRAQTPQHPSANDSVRTRRNSR